MFGRCRYQSGNALPETTLILILVAGIAITQLGNLGASIEKALGGSGFSGDELLEPEIANGGSGSDDGTEPNTENGETPSPPNPGGSNGFYPADGLSGEQLGQLIEVAGASGTTEEMALKLKELAQQLKKEGDLEAANVLFDLAKLGQQISNKMRAMDGKLYTAMKTDYKETYGYTGKINKGDYAYLANMPTTSNMEAVLADFNAQWAKAQSVLASTSHSDLIAPVGGLTGDINTVTNAYGSQMNQMRADVEYLLSGEGQNTQNQWDLRGDQKAFYKDKNMAIAKVVVSQKSDQIHDHGQHL